MSTEQREATRDGRTHWDGCWEHRGHHGCAIARVRELEAARSPGGRERELLEKIVMRAIKDGNYWRLDLDLQDEIRAALSAVPVGPQQLDALRGVGEAGTSNPTSVGGADDLTVCHADAEPGEASDTPVRLPAVPVGQPSAESAPTPPSSGARPGGRAMSARAKRAEHTEGAEEPVDPDGVEFGATWNERLVQEIVPAIAILSRYEAAGCAWWISGDGHTGYTAGCTCDQGRFEAHSRVSIYRAAYDADRLASQAIGRARVREIEAARALLPTAAVAPSASPEETKVVQAFTSRGYGEGSVTGIVVAGAPPEAREERSGTERRRGYAVGYTARSGSLAPPYRTDDSRPDRRRQPNRGRAARRETEGQP